MFIFGVILSYEARPSEGALFFTLAHAFSAKTTKIRGIEAQNPIDFPGLKCYTFLDYVNLNSILPYFRKTKKSGGGGFLQ